MRLSNYQYLIYTAVFAFCTAWFVSGWISMSTASDIDFSSDSKSKSKRKLVKLPNTKLIIDKNIFKADTGAPVVSEIEKRTVVEAGGAISASPAGFKAELQGIVSGDGESMAVVNYNSKKYILRENIEQDGITLIEAGFYHVIVRYEGKEYRLVLISDKGKTSGGNRSSQVKSRGSSGSENYKISRKEVVEKLTNVNDVIKSVLIVPFERNGQFEGYKVRRIAGKSVLKKLGIKRNDVIMRLNGKSLDTPTVFFETLKNAENVSNVTLDILRGGKKKTIFVEIEG